MNELKIEKGNGALPKEPDWSEVYNDSDKQVGAHQYWVEIVHEMVEAGTISAVNGHAIFRVVAMRIEFDGAQLEIATKGRLITGGHKKTGAQAVNSNWGCMMKSAEMLMQLEAELGLSPRRRASATKVSRGKKTTAAPAASYLKAVS